MKEFTEKQKFNQWWIWLIVALATVVCTWGLIQQVIFKIPFGTKPASDELLIAVCMVPLVLIIMFQGLCLETKINEDGVYYRFKFFHGKPRQIKWEEIQKIYVREYKPVKEYGGWGIRGSFKNGKAFNVSGNIGIQLELTSGKKLLLGTQKQSEVETVLLQLKK